jgi:hemerythrin-like domain-containing protein
MSSSLADPSRRAAFALVGAAGAGLALTLPGCSRPASDDDDTTQPDVTAVEDLMREHGILRRLLVVYRETAGLIRQGARSLDLAALGQAVDLFRTFGEDYHEKSLEEAHVFPMVKKAGGRASSLIDTLVDQHNRGRAINDFISARVKTGSVGDGAPLADALSSFARMYESHAALEDTVVFEAWKAQLGRKELNRWSDIFEDLERATFKGDGFDLALEQVSAIEQRLGLSNLAAFTAPPPPQA